MRLTESMRGMLTALWDDAPLSAAELASILGEPVSSVQSRLRRGIAAGWIDRERGEERHYMYSLTPAGAGKVAP